MFEFKKPDFAKLKAELSKLKPDFTPVTKFLSGLFVADKWGLDTSRPAPVLDSYISQLADTLKIQPVSQKVSALLALGDTARADLDVLSAQANKNAATSLGAGLLGLVATAASLALVPFVPYLALPLVALSVIGSGMSAASAYSNFQTREQVDIDRHTFTRQIRAEVAGIVAASPQEAAQSPRFRESPKSEFNAAATPYQAEAFMELKTRVDVFRAAKAPAVTA